MQQTTRSRIEKYAMALTTGKEITASEISKDIHTKDMSPRCVSRILASMETVMEFIPNSGRPGCSGKWRRL